jgi:hypothetical protein
MAKENERKWRINNGEIIMKAAAGGESGYRNDMSAQWRRIMASKKIINESWYLSKAAWRIGENSKKKAISIKPRRNGEYPQSRHQSAGCNVVAKILKWQRLWLA